MTAPEPTLRFLDRLLGDAPNPALYVPSAEMEQAFAAVEDALGAGDRAVLVTGPIGFGKTLLLRVLATRGPTPERFVYVPFLALPAAETASWLLGLLGEQASSERLAETALLGCFHARRAAGEHTVLLVDEAHSIPAETAERLRDLAHRAGDALQLVLAGIEGSALDEVAACFPERPRCIPLRAPLTGRDVERTISRMLEIASEEQEPQAVAWLAALDGAELLRASGGVPRELRSQMLRRWLEPGDAAVVERVPSAQRSGHAERVTGRGRAGAARSTSRDGGVEVEERHEPPPEPDPPPSALQGLPAAESPAPVERAPAARPPAVRARHEAARQVHRAGVVGRRLGLRAGRAARREAGRLRRWIVAASRRGLARAAVFPRRAGTWLREATAVIRGRAREQGRVLAARASSAARAGGRRATAGLGAAASVSLQRVEATRSGAAAALRRARAKGAQASHAGFSGRVAFVSVGIAAVGLGLFMLRADEPEPGLDAPRSRASAPDVAAVPAVPFRASAADAAAVPAVPSRASTPDVAAGPAIPPPAPAPLDLPEPGAAPLGIRQPSAPAAAAPQPVLVNVNAVPWARIRVDGRDLGYTPLGNIPLDPGPHRFEAEMSDGRVLRRLVVVGSDERLVSFQ